MAITPSGKDKTINNLRIYAGGYDLSGDARTFSNLAGVYEEVDMTGWSNAVFNYQAGRGTAGIRGFQALMNDATGQAWDRLKSPGNTTTQVAICFGGGGAPEVGDPAYHISGVQISNPVGFDSSAATVTADFIPNGASAGHPVGYTLRGATSLAASLTASSSNSIDLGAAAAFGWTASLHILATSSGDFALSIMHSTDDSSFSTLGTFTSTGGSIGSEYLTGSGTVNRYVAFNAVRTAGTITAVIVFSRNNR